MYIISENIADLIDVDAGSYFKLKKDDEIFDPGDEAGDIFLVLQGKIGLYKIDDRGQEEPVEVIGAGQIFGELALISGEKRKLMARARGKSVCLSLSRDEFWQLLENKPDLNRRMILILTERLDKLLSGSESAIEVMDEEHEEEKPEEKDPDLAGGLFPEEHEDYKKRAPEKFDNYLYEKKVKCPVCDSTLQVKKVRNSRLRLEEMRDDLRPVYTDFKPSWYFIWVCQQCFYAAPKRHFEELGKDNREKIQEDFRKKILEHIGDDFSPGFSDPRYLQEVFQAYYLSVKLLEFVEAEGNITGGCWLRLSWLYEDMGNKELQEKSAINALNCLEKYYFEEYSGELSTQAEHKLTLLLAGLMIDYGDDPEKALPLLDEIIRDRKTKKLYRRMARERFTALRESRKSDSPK